MNHSDRRDAQIRRDVNAPRTRRDVLRGSAQLGAAAFAATALPAALARQDDGADAKKRMLILGGTAFLGPQIVQAALDAGWAVTLYNRGKTAPDRFPDLDLRVGDRNENDYASLAEGSWDLVVDTSGYIPQHVTDAIDALGGADGGRVGHYVFVSTLSVYDQEAAKGLPITEDAPVLTLEPEERARFERIQDVTGAAYGALKFHCEEAAEAALPGKVTVIRPGLIVGPEDRSDRYTYWPVRMAEGGDVLAPGDPDATTDFIDVRDLGPFCFARGAAEDGRTMNATGFDRPVTFREMLESCRVEGVDANLRWASDEFLLEQGVQPWMGLPLWIPGGERPFANVLAIRAGLTFRALEDTAAATLAWAKENRGEGHRWRAGITREKEREVLAALDG